MEKYDVKPLENPMAATLPLEKSDAFSNVEKTWLFIVTESIL
jgi:hypothetical protein